MPPYTDGPGTLTIEDIAAYAKLSRADIDAIGTEFDTIRRDIEESLGARDAAYIRRTIVFQRALDVAARLLITGARSKAGVLAGTVALAYAKSVENMEIAHNVGHGRWDWMNDPEIHSTTWGGTRWVRRRSGAIRATTPPTYSAMAGRGRRPRLRHPADEPRSAVGTSASGAAAAECAVGHDRRVGDRPTRLLLRRDRADTEGRNAARYPGQHADLGPCTSDQKAVPPLPARAGTRWCAECEYSIQRETGARLRCQRRRVSNSVPIESEMSAVRLNFA